MGHILDTGIRCSRAIRVGISIAPNEGRSAKLRPCCQSLGNIGTSSGSTSLIIMTGGGGTIRRFYLEQYSMQLKLLPIVSQPSKCLKFFTFREGCVVMSN